MGIIKKTYSLGIVLILAIVTLSLSSWKSPQTKKRVSDTTKRAKKESGYSRKTIITLDDLGQPHEEIIESFEGDEDLSDLLRMNSDFNFDFPPFPDLNFNFPDLPSIDFPPFAFKLDSLELERFSFNEDRLQNLELLGPELEERMQMLNDQLKGLDFQINEQFNGDLEEKLLQLNDKLQSLDQLHFDLEPLEMYTEQLKEFEKTIQKELIADGYLKEGEKIESMNWSDDEIEINEKLIKEEHLQKYRDLKELHFKKNWKPGRIE